MEVENDNFLKYIKTNGIILAIAIYLIVIVYYSTKDPDKLFTSTYIKATIIIIPTIIAAIYSLKSSSSPTTTTSQFTISDYFRYGIGIIIFIGLLYFLSVINFTEKLVYLGTGIIQLLFFSMIIVALAIVYKLAYNYLYKMQGISGFIAKLIFYIPCMLLDLLEYIKSDLNQAPKAVYVLLIIELILGLLYIYVPKISDSISKSISLNNGTVIVSEPIRIDREKRLSSYVSLQKTKIKNTDKIVNSKYAISAWVYIVPVEPSHSPYNSDATIFEYTDYHPKLIFNGAKSKFKAFFNQSKFEEFDMPLQKWNHVLFNYTKSNADLFVNGVLMGSTVRDSLNEGLSVDDIFLAGQENGLSGGVCNIVYFGRPLAKYEIEMIYNVNKDREPPIV